MQHIIRILSFISFLTSISGQSSSNITLLGQTMTDDVRYSGSWAYTAPDSTEYALIGARTGLAIFPIDNPNDMPLLDFIPGPSTNWREVTVIGQHAFVVTDVSDVGHTMQVIDLSPLPDSVNLITEYNTTFTKGHIIQKDIYNESPYVYVNGTEETDGVHILDITDPTNPIEVGLYQPGYYIHDCHVRDTLLFACAFFESKVDILSIANKTNPTLIGTIGYDGANSHSCFTSIDGNYLFVCDELDGLPARIFDISDLSDPKEVASYSANLESLVHNPYIRGDYTFIAHNTEGLRVVDIADPELPIEVGHYDTWDQESGGFNGLWSACPFFPSGKIIGANRHDGLYVWEFNNTQAARIYGKVYEQATGTAIANANVQLTTNDTILLTDIFGNFKYGMLAGNYEIIVEEAGFEPFMVNIDLNEGDSIWIDIPLTQEGVNAVNAPQSDIDMEVFPNPFTDFIELNWSGNAAIHSFSIYDGGGQLVAQRMLPTNGIRFETNDWSAGVYTIVAINDHQRVLFKEILVKK